MLKDGQKTDQSALRGISSTNYEDEEDEKEDNADKAGNSGSDIDLE